MGHLSTRKLRGALITKMNRRLETAVPATRVGVIVPVRAPAPFLAEALASVLAQEPRPDVVVVVDHGSDPPLEAPLGTTLVRLDDADGGPATARDAGLDALRAHTVELVALADADDVWEPAKLAAQLEAMARHGGAAVCFGRATIVDGDGAPTGERWPELASGLHPAESLRGVLFESNPIPAASAVLRRSALEAVGDFGAQRGLTAASDWDLWLRLVAAGYDFVCEPRARIRYRRHAGGVTQDIASLAEAGLALHEAHAQLVDPELARRIRARDLTSLARGRIRQRRFSEAREALREAAELEPPTPRDRALRMVAAVPGLRAGLGRRNPYRPAR
jgi:Glycosyltransferase like family 2